MNKATIKITATAALKMNALVHAYNKEVGWFGLVEKLEKGVYKIYDVVLFPQYTTSAYIDDEGDDPQEFERWLQTLPDEVFDARRLCGHSHVNMTPTPSGTDKAMYERQIDAVIRSDVNRFVICQIMNKKNKVWWYIFDADDEVDYVAGEIETEIELGDGECTTTDWLNANAHYVRDYTYRKGVWHYEYK